MIPEYVLFRDQLELAEAIIQAGNSFEQLDALMAKTPSSAASVLARVRREGLGVSSMRGTRLDGDQWLWSVVCAGRLGIDEYQFVGPSVDAAKSLISAQAIGSAVPNPGTAIKAMATRKDTL